jgi:hypothetical protein
MDRVAAIIAARRNRGFEDFQVQILENKLLSG